MIRLLQADNAVLEQDNEKLLKTIHDLEDKLRKYVGIHELLKIEHCDGLDKIQQHLVVISKHEQTIHRLEEEINGHCSNFSTLKETHINICNEKSSL